MLVLGINQSRWYRTLRPNLQWYFKLDII